MKQSCFCGFQYPARAKPGRCGGCEKDHETEPPARVPLTEPAPGARGGRAGLGLPAIGDVVSVRGVRLPVACLFVRCGQKPHCENCRRGIIMWFKPPPPPPPPPPPLPFLLSRTAFDTAIFILCVSFFVAWIYGTIRKCSCKKLASGGNSSSACWHSMPQGGVCDTKAARQTDRRARNRIRNVRPDHSCTSRETRPPRRRLGAT